MINIWFWFRTILTTILQYLIIKWKKETRTITGRPRSVMASDTTLSTTRTRSTWPRAAQAEVTRGEERRGTRSPAETSAWTTAAPSSSSSSSSASSSPSSSSLFDASSWRKLSGIWDYNWETAASCQNIPNTQSARHLQKNLLHFFLAENFKQMMYLDIFLWNI